jgi:4-alpha-glucanotransferase
MSLPRIRFQSARDFEDAVHRAAVEWGIEREFWDIFGNYHASTAETEARILASIGIPTSSFDELERARIRRFESSVEKLLASTVVVGEHDKSVELSMPAGADSYVSFEVNLESGHVLRGTAGTHDLVPLREIEREDRTWRVYKVLLPPETPLGYHTMDVRTANGSLSATSTLIVCPDRAFVPDDLHPGFRAAGFAVTLWGLRSSRNWGCGDFSDLRTLADWVASDARCSFIGLNPLHLLHNRAPYNTSPYLPLSIFYKNPIYIDIEAVPEFESSAAASRILHSDDLQRQLEELRNAEFVQYEQVNRLKKRFLKLLFRQFRHESERGSQRAVAFAEYVRQEGDLLEKAALYCALDEVLHKRDRKLWTWRDWPSEYQDPSSEACRQFADEHRLTIDFYKYVQFVIDEQLDAAQQYAKGRGLPIGLYHDLALATDSCGADLWAHRNFYVTGCRVGSPPDAFAPKGQDWAFPPPNTIAHKENGYQLFRESIRKIVRHGGALRIDHVMRLFRLFWIPDRIEAADGVYVSDNVTDLLRVLALESVRSRNIIVGEDLGTVTDAMRETLARFGVLSYRLLYFEKWKDGTFKLSSDYPRQALVSSTTHDLPTVAGFWAHRDIDARRSAGLINDDGYRAQLGDRLREKQRMLDALHREGLLPHDYTRDASQINQLDGALHNATVGFLAQTPSALLLFNQEDLTKETEQQNLPGSTGEYPNWSRKMKWTLEELMQSETARAHTAMLRHQLERTDRALPSSPGSAK